MVSESPSAPPRRTRPCHLFGAPLKLLFFMGNMGKPWEKPHEFDGKWERPRCFSIFWDLKWTLHGRCRYIAHQRVWANGVRSAKTAPVRSKQFFLRNYARVVSPLRRSQPRRSDDVQVQHLPESQLDILANWVPAPPLAFNLRWAGCIQHSDTGRGRKNIFWGYLGILGILRYYW
jgi:hypothetical protein